MGFDGSSIEGSARIDESDRVILPEPIEENVYEMTEDERQRNGIGTLAASLLEAILLTENSELMQKL